MVQSSRSVHRCTLITPHRFSTLRIGPLVVVLLLLIIALSAAACGGSVTDVSPAGDSPVSADGTAALPADTGGTGDGGAVEPIVVAEPQATPRPTATPASRAAMLRWGQDEAAAAAVEWSVTGGAAVVENERYCLAPSGGDTALALVPAMALTASGDPPFGILSAQVLASPPNVEGTTVGLGACGVLLEVDDQQQWRETPLGADGAPGKPGDWLADPGLRLGGQHALGILCEAGITTLVGDGAILAQQASAADTPAHVGLGASIPAGAGEKVCFDGLRVEVWADGAEESGDDRQAILYELGNPDAFVIEFEQTPEGGLYRVETWTYVDVGMTLTFSDGVLIETAGVDPSADDIAAWPVDYDPLAFAAEMTLDDIQSLLAGQELVSLEVPEEFGAGMVLYAGDQIVFGFTEGTLEFVQTLAIGVEPEEVAP